ncbi:MAG: PIN domain-containing protein [Stackebrandtia sp.]
MILVDTNVLVAYVNSLDPNYAAACRVFDNAPEAATSPLVIAEFDYLIRTRFDGHSARQAIRAVLGDGLQIAEIGDQDVLQAADFDEQFRDLNIGITDATLALLAARLDTRDIATFDHRHFRAVKPLQGGEFRLLPADLD